MTTQEQIREMSTAVLEMALTPALIEKFSWMTVEEMRAELKRRQTEEAQR